MNSTLLEKLLGRPQAFTDQDFLSMVSGADAVTFGDIRRAMTRVFNVNESELHARSNPSTGFMGFANRVKHGWRNAAYLAEVRRRTDDAPRKKVVLAEGDSWFNFPVPWHRDVIDAIGAGGTYTMISMAYAGDWLTNIVYEGKYIAELNINKPDVFLVSGGGNDLVGDRGVASFVCGGECKEQLEHPLFANAEPPIRGGLKHVNKDYFAFLLLMKAQYWLLLSSLARVETVDHRPLQVILQGYDYPFPRRPRGLERCNPVHRASGTGSWLHDPLKIARICDPILQRNVLAALLYGFNEVLSWLVQHFPNAYLVDSRGAFPELSHWYDEIHLTSESWNLVARAYREIIDAPQPPKIVRTRDLRSASLTSAAASRTAPATPRSP